MNYKTTTGYNCYTITTKYSDCYEAIKDYLASWVADWDFSFKTLECYSYYLIKIFASELEWELCLENDIAVIKEEYENY